MTHISFEEIQMGINPKVLVADNGYMNDNVVKYAYENNMRLLIPDRNESSKTNSKNREKPYHKVNFTYDWKKRLIHLPNERTLTLQK